MGLRLRARRFCALGGPGLPAAARHRSDQPLATADNLMPMPPQPGRCVHCLSYHESLTWDHVFPVAWYPDTTPEGTEKWKVPSCEECNRSHGETENILM